jgi:hypothetical protein
MNEPRRPITVLLLVVAMVVLYLFALRGLNLMPLP